MNVFDQGLLNAGPTRAARLLDFPGFDLWLTNDVREGFATVWRFFAFPGYWEPIYGFVPANGPFPYGRNVSPP